MTGPARRRAGAAAAILFAVAAAQAATPAAAATALPKDPAAHGYVGLCDESGRNVIGGSLDSKPFVWKAIASQPPPANYQGPGQNAVLNMYQPRPEVLPSDWSGQALTGASFYTSKAHPAVQATYRDLSLGQFTSEFPALVDGLYVLRIFFGKANYGLYSATYPTSTIRVIGRRWELVAGGNVDCRASVARSDEALTGVASTRDATPRKPDPAFRVVSDPTIGATRPTPAAHTSPPSTVAPRSASGSAGASRTSPGARSAAGSSGAAATSPAPAAAHRTAGSSLDWLGWPIAGVLGLAVLAGLALRRRSTADPPKG